MERQNAKLLDEVLKELIKKEGLEDSLFRVRLFEAWDRKAGIQAARATTSKFYKNGILYCTISSSVLRNQLYYSLDGLLKSINQEFPDNPISKIVLR